MPKIQWLKSAQHYRKLILTICRFRKEGRNDLRGFCQSDLNTFNVPYATLQQHCPLGREQSYPDFQGPNGLLSSNEHAIVVTKCYHEEIDDIALIANLIVAVTQSRVNVKQAKPIAVRIRTEVQTIRESPPMGTDFARFLVFQTTISDDHPLKYYTVPEVKEAHRHHHALFPYNVVEKETYVAMTRMGCYVSKGLHKVPHCNELVVNLNLCENMARANNIELQYFPAELTKAITDELQVFRENSPEMLAVPIILFPTEQMFRYTIDNVNPGSVDRHHGNSWSIDVGFAQAQGANSDLSVWEEVDGHRFSLPLFKIDGRRFLANMPPDLGHAFGELITHIQNVVLAHHPNAMNDDFRRRTFKDLWEEHGFTSHQILFEYINIIIKPEHGDVALKLHMDYKNDSREGYDLCPVFWYLHRHTDGRLYRVTIVMTFRDVCGKAMEKMRGLF